VAANYRLELRRAFQASDGGDQQPFGNATSLGLTEDPSDDDRILLEIMYSLGVNVGYARGFVHATALLLVAMLAAVVWASL
jgi:hypothetical protein